MVRVLGPLLVQNESQTFGPRDFGGARPKQVLEILLAARGHSVPVDRLTELVWGDEPPQNAAGSLQTFISVLRRHLARRRDVSRRLVVTEPEAYRFATELILFDLDRFDVLLEQSARQPTRVARASLEQALDLVRGEAFEDEPYAGWAVDLRGSYQGRILGARLDAADLALAERDFASALDHSAAAVSLDRFSERAQRTQMLALYALGRGHEALDRYRGFRARLDEELGLDPATETRRLESAILRQDDVHRLLPRPLQRTPMARGGDSPRLLGRTAEFEQLSASVRRALEGRLSLVHIESDSGLGKTRLLEEIRHQFDGIRIGVASATVLESHLPYVPLATALREALIDRELVVESAPALGQILPELRVGAQDKDLEELDALEALVATVADHAPLVLMLDDMQFSDSQTIAALGYLRRRGADLPVAIVTAANPTQIQADHALRRLTPDLVIGLEPLSAADLAPLGIAGLHERTGGHPRFIQEELTAMHRSAPSSTLAQALVTQCRAEGPFGYRVLVAASILAQPFPPEPVAELVDAEPTSVTEELERLCEQRILRVDGPGFRFRYELVREALLGSISPARQRLLQERLRPHPPHSATARPNAGAPRG